MILTSIVTVTWTDKFFFCFTCNKILKSKEKQKNVKEKKKSLQPDHPPPRGWRGKESLSCRNGSRQGSLHPQGSSTL